MGIFDSKYTELISEGLTRSYNTDVYLKLLGKKLKELGIYSEVELDKTSRIFHGDSYRMLLETDEPIEDLEEIKQLNRVCGYVIIGVKQALGSYFTSIEKVFPQEEPLNFENVAKFFNFKKEKCALYHVTRAELARKIQRIGLSPRDTQTTFKHPGGRIYLFFSIRGGDLDHIRLLAKIIAKNRALHKKSSYIPEYSIYRITPTDDIKYYFDPSLNIRDGFAGFGVFTKQNIPPQYITEVSRFDPEDDWDFNEVEDDDME